MALYGNKQISGNEAFFAENETIVSKTDLTGKLVYGNEVFYRLAGLSEKECLGQQHNIIRHPEMPRCVFDLLWETIKSGEEIFAYVNNRSANGDNYWVFAHVTPSRDKDGNIVGYYSNRRVPDRKVLDDHIIPFYKELLETELSISSPKEALEASRAKIADKLAEHKMTFNEWMFALNA